MDRAISLQSLGLRRNLVLDCLGANTPQAPGFLEVLPGANMLAVYEELCCRAVVQRRLPGRPHDNAAAGGRSTADRRDWLRGHCARSLARRSASAEVRPALLPISAIPDAARRITATERAS